MPEGDAVRRTAIRLHAALAGHEVTDWDLRWPGVSASDLRGSTTLEVTSRGKHLLHRLDSGWTLRTHLRMEGHWRVWQPAELPRQLVGSHRVRALVGCRTATGLGMQLGMVTLARTRDEARLLSHLGPDILGDDWDAAEAVRRIRGSGPRSIGACLLDQECLAGVGTIWCSEVLFWERVHPLTDAAALSDETLGRIVDRAHHLLTATMAFDSSVSTGDPLQPTFVHDRAGRNCRRCGRRVGHGVVTDGARRRRVFWCVTCQRS